MKKLRFTFAINTKAVIEANNQGEARAALRQLLHIPEPDPAVREYTIELADVSPIPGGGE